jgi:hypothetical protein
MLAQQIADQRQYVLDRVRELRAASTKEKVDPTYCGGLLAKLFDADHELQRLQAEADSP